jgi:hypothetical protein
VAAEPARVRAAAVQGLRTINAAIDFVSVSSTRATAKWSVFRAADGAWAAANQDTYSSQEMHQ